MLTSIIRHPVRSIAVQAAALLLALAAQPAGAANLIVNGSFELPPLHGFNTTYHAGSPQLTGWAIGGQGIDHDTTFQAADGVQTISTSWTQSSNVSQQVATAPVWYTVTFAATRERPELAAGMSSTRGVNVLWNNVSVGTVMLLPDATQTNIDMHWRDYSFSVLGTGGLDELKFADIASGTSGFGVELDNVRMDIPAPGASVLLAVGGLVAVRRRR